MKRVFLISIVVLLLLKGCAALERPSLDPYREFFSDPVAPAPAWEKGRVKVTFLGTTSLFFTDGETNLMIDGFLTRPGPAIDLLLRPIETNRERVRNYLHRLKIERLEAIFVYHSHHDHAMDAPYIALLTGAEIVGSESTAMIARGEGLGRNQIRVLKPYQPMRYGKFTVTMIPSRHVDLPFVANLLGMMGQLDKPLQQPASVFAYREGGTYTIHVAHPQGSAILHGGQYQANELRGLKADALFLCTPGLDRLGANSEAFYEEVVVQPGVKTLYPVHWDDFSLPLDQPLQPLPRGAEDLHKAMKYLLEHRQQRNPQLSIRFLRGWEETILGS